MAAAALHLGSRLAADEGHVDLQSLAFASDGRQPRPLAHDFADAVHEEPSGLHAAIEGPLDLPGPNALLAGANELDRLQPKMQRKMAVLEDGADPEP